MNLNELIFELEKYPRTRVARNGFFKPHSYRGYYDELCFEPHPNVTVTQMLDSAREALGSTYQGWKGGDYTMTGETAVHLAEEGNCEEEPFTTLHVAAMLGSIGGVDRERLARSVAIELYRDGLIRSIDAATEDRVRAAIDAALDEDVTT